MNTPLVRPADDSDPYGDPAPSFPTATDSYGHRFAFTEPTNPRCLLMWEREPGEWVNDFVHGYPSPTLEVFRELARQGAFAPPSRADD